MVVISSFQQQRTPTKKEDMQEERVGNNAVDARLLTAEEPSVPSPVPGQPQRTLLSPPPVRARRAPAVGTADRLAAPWLCWTLCVRAFVHPQYLVPLLLPYTSKREYQSTAAPPPPPPPPQTRTRTDSLLHHIVISTVKTTLYTFTFGPQN